MSATTLLTAQPARYASPTAKATRLTHLIFERPNLASAEAFLTDFGLQVVSRDACTLLLRGSGSAPYCYRVQLGERARFIGLGFAVGSRAELEKLAALPGASAIEAITLPGGGEGLRLRDPSGFAVEILHGQQTVPDVRRRAPMAMNLGELQPRINATQRSSVEPPQVLRLGHVVLEVADYQATCGWYTQHLGLIPSDVQVLPDGSPAVAFLRLDLGDTPADHHTLALAQGFMPLYSHSAYEVIDPDAVGMGQRVLRERGYKHAWGIGRHILGSQIFDYWKDPFGDKHEHYCDGDVFTADVPTGVHPVSREAMSQWGQPMPASFTKPSFTPAKIVALIGNLRRSPDLSIKKLMTLARLFG